MVRRPFILLEALIAIAILSSTLIPLSSAPYKRYAHELECFRAFELERLSGLAFAETLNHLPELVKNRKLSLTPQTLHLDPLPSTTYTVEATLTPHPDDTNEPTSPHHLWQCTLTFSSPASPNHFTTNRLLFTSQT